MICVVEHGQDIGSIKNYFIDIDKAKRFANYLVTVAHCKYEKISETQWICLEKDEAIEIETD
jgi:hypothetical protein